MSTQNVSINNGQSINTDHLTVNTKHKVSFHTDLDDTTPTNSINIARTPRAPRKSLSRKFKTKNKQNKQDIETPQKMQPNTRTITLQISLCITGAIVAIIYIFARDMVEIYYPCAFLWITIGTIFAYYEIDFNSFLTTFRGLIISVSVFISILCDFLRHFLTKDDNEWFFTILIGSIAWTYAITYMIFLTDSAPRILNFVRFLGPFIVLLYTLWYIIDHFFLQPDDDFTIFTLYKGSLTLNDIELWSKTQIVWFGCSFILSVWFDPKHKYFVLMDDRVLTKILLPYRNISIDTTTFFYGKITIKTVYMFHIITIIGSIYGILYLFVLSYNNYSIPSDIGVVISIALCTVFGIILYILFGILVIKYFQLFIAKQLLMQFRANMLIVTVLILIYITIQKIIWENHINVLFIISIIFNYCVFILGVFALLIRDGMHILYPIYFVLYFCVLLLIISIWNIFLLTFDKSNNNYPLYFILLEKQAYFQVIVICVLNLYYWIRDRNSHYFSLIRQRKQTKQLWNDPIEKYQSLTEYDIDVSSYFVNRSRHPSQIETLNSAIIDGSGGNHAL